MIFGGLTSINHTNTKIDIPPDKNNPENRAASNKRLKISGAIPNRTAIFPGRDEIRANEAHLYSKRAILILPRPTSEQTP
jgi:hypothetical protein